MGATRGWPSCAGAGACTCACGALLAMAREPCAVMTCQTLTFLRAHDGMIVLVPVDLSCWLTLVRDVSCSVVCRLQCPHTSSMAARRVCWTTCRAHRCIASFYAGVTQDMTASVVSRVIIDLVVCHELPHAAPCP